MDEVGEYLDRYIEKDVKNHAIAIKFKDDVIINIVNKYCYSYLRYMDKEDYNQEVCLILIDLIKSFIDRHEEVNSEFLDKYIKKYLSKRLLTKIQKIRKDEQKNEEALAETSKFHSIFINDNDNSKLLEFRKWFKEEGYNYLTDNQKDTFNYLIKAESNNIVLSITEHKRKYRLIKKINKKWDEFKVVNAYYIDLNHKILLEFENLIMEEDEDKLKEYINDYLSEEYEYILEVATKNLTTEEVKNLGSLSLDLKLDNVLFRKISINLLNELYKKDARFLKKSAE